MDQSNYNFLEWTLFLDRDGVINEELPNDYVKYWEEFQFYPTSLDALELLNFFFKNIFIVTNQRGVGLGIFSPETLNQIHKNMLDIIQSQHGRIDAVFASIDRDDNAFNRKPQPGLAFQAKDLFPHIEFNKSIMVGNSRSDMLFGKNLGMKTVYICSTNFDYHEFDFLIDYVYPNLLEFAREFIYLTLLNFWDKKKAFPKVIHFSCINNELEKNFEKFQKAEKKQYTDYELSILPNIDEYMLHQKEWKIVHETSNRFLDYLDSKKTNLQILHVGCGNGWFTNQLGTNSNYRVTAINAVSFPLNQAARVFPKNNICFVLADIFEIDFQFQFQFDIIVLQNSVQYYPKINILLDKLKSFLKPAGEIHIFDCPIYNKFDLNKEEKKYVAYLKKISCLEMARYTFFHSDEKFRDFEVKYNPPAPWKRRFFYPLSSPFKWFKYVKK